MFLAVLIAAVVAATAADSPNCSKTPVQRCFGTLDGAVSHGDPTDRNVMKANLAACLSGLSQIEHMRPGAAHGPAELFLLGRILDRAATLSYLGLDDAPSALREVKTANLYFRIAAGLPSESANYHAAALADVQLTALQRQTLTTDIAAAARRAPVVALRAHEVRHAHARPAAAAAYTAYHKL